MSVIYCSKCGKKHEYNLAKPNFCSSCGNPLGAMLPKDKKNKQKEEELDDDLDDDFDDDDDDDDDDGDFSNARSVPHIKKIAVEVEASSSYTQFALSSLIGSGGDEANPVKKTRARRKTLDDFKNDKSK
jgi:ribosomal protein L37E